MASEDRQVTIPEFVAWKGQGRRISVLTAYDYPTARLLDAAGVDCLLVGDSMGTTVQGRETTLAVTLDQIDLSRRDGGPRRQAGARRGRPAVPLLPGSRRQAIRSAGRVLKETSCQAVKLEGGRRLGPRRSGPWSRPRFPSWGTWG